jgi:flagellar biosynthesis/type III secretory pathway M-ring protein FliF/YscJ
VLTVVSNVQAIGGANLSSNDIVVIAGSEMLHGPTDDEFARMAGDRSRHQTAVESYYTKKIEMALARLGAETVVMVSAEHDWSSVDTAARTLPGEAKVISLQETTSETTVTERPPEGAPGVNANPPYGGGADGEPTTKTETSEMIENSDYPETLTNTKLPPGRLVAMKVGIAVNGTEKPAVDADGNETGEMDYVPPPPELIATITSLAQHAVADATVADVITPPQISVTGVRFMRPTTVTAGVVTPSNWWQNSTVRLGGQLLLMLIAFFVIRSFMRRAMAVPGEEAEEVEEVVEVDHEAERRKRVAEEVERLSNEEPEAVASLLRTWMIEE